MAGILRQVWQERPRVWNNPVIKRELIEHLRKPMMFLFFGIFLFFCYINFNSFWLELLQRNYAYIRQFLIGFIAIHGLFVFALVPILSANSLNQEFERDSWDLLQTTHLNTASIVIGKFFSSFIFLWLLSLALIPFYSIMLTLGSIAPSDIFYAALLITEGILIITLIGLFCSSLFRKPIGAITSTYLFSLLYLGGGVFIKFIDDIIGFNLIHYQISDEFPISLCVWAQSPITVAIFTFLDSPYPIGNSTYTKLYIAHILITIASALILYLLCLRFLSAKSKGRSRAAWQIKMYERSLPAEKKENYIYALETPDTENPLTHKALNDSRVRNYFWHRMWYLVLIVIGLIVPFLFLGNQNMFGKEYQYFFVFLFSPFIIFPYAVNIFREEIDRDTLPMVLNTPISNRSIIYGKLKAGFILYAKRILLLYWVMLISDCLILPGLASLTGHPIDSASTPIDLRYFQMFLFSLYVTLVLGVFYLSLGMYFSVNSVNTLYAYFKMVMFSMVLFVGLPCSLFLLVVLSFFSPDFLMNTIVGTVSPVAFYWVLNQGHSVTWLRTLVAIALQLSWISVVVYIFIEHADMFLRDEREN